MANINSERVSVFPGFPEHEAVADVFHPRKQVSKAKPTPDGAAEIGAACLRLLHRSKT
jgi:hypothetical protein